MRSPVARPAVSGTVPVSAGSLAARQRVVWCDVAKGLAIILVVYYHAMMGVDFDVPIDRWWERTLALPLTYFRMPLFFFASGIFAAISVQRGWRLFTDRTLLHLAYLFVIWNLLHLLVRVLFASYLNNPMPDPVHTLLVFLFDPLDNTWFIEVLCIFYIALRLLRNLPPFAIVAGAAVLALLPESQNLVIERTQSLFVFFALGYAISRTMRTSDWHPDGWLVAVLLAAFGMLSVLFVNSDVVTSRSLTLLVSCLGVAAATGLAMWISRRRHFGWLLYVGRHTLPVFVMHTMFTAPTREILLRTGITGNLVVLIAVTTLVGVVGPLVVYAVCEWLHFPWLFERPQQLHLPIPPQTARTLPD